jgi:DNA-binding response OmpR family regulator
VHLAKSFKPDLFIIDLMLQDGDGFSVIKGLRQITIFKKTPILTLSNLGQETDISEAKKIGTTRYLIKSNVRFEDILTNVNELLK